MEEKSDSDSFEAGIVAAIKKFSRKHSNDSEELSLKKLRRYVEKKLGLEKNDLASSVYEEYLIAKYVECTQSVGGDSLPHDQTDNDLKPLPLTRSINDFSTSTDSIHKSHENSIDSVEKSSNNVRLSSTLDQDNHSSSDHEGTRKSTKRNKMVSGPTLNQDSKHDSSDKETEQDNELTVDKSKPQRKIAKTKIASADTNSNYNADNSSKSVAVNAVANRFSNQESDLILSLCEAYLESNGLEKSALLSVLRDGTRSRQHTAFWRSLHARFPHRNPQAVYRKARALLLQSDKPGWTNEEVETLFKMVEIYGTDWKTIGVKMERLSSDVKTKYRNKVKAEKSGAFSPEEDDSLIKAIQRISGSDNAKELPVLNIPWADIARDLGSIRRPNDYYRRWKVLYRSLIRKVATTLTVDGAIESNIPNHDLKNIESSDGIQLVALTSPRISEKITESTESGTPTLVLGLPTDSISIVQKRGGGNMSDLDLINYLRDSGAEDEIEVCFADIDRKFVNRVSYADRRWIALKKSCPSYIKNFKAQLEYLYDRESQSEPVETGVKKNKRYRKMSRDASIKHALANIWDDDQDSD